jgi:hypothetical protein
MNRVGTGCDGSASYLLNQLNGIFVDTNFDLYVADTVNDRIQKFAHGQLNGITLIDSKTMNFILYRPTSIVLNADEYLFIVDSENHRIIRSLPNNGFECLIGCSDVPCSMFSQLCEPRTLAFDSIGNLYVSDLKNARVQQFLLTNKSCGK